MQVTSKIVWYEDRPAVIVSRPEEGQLLIGLLGDPDVTLLVTDSQVSRFGDREQWFYQQLENRPVQPDELSRELLFLKRILSEEQTLPYVLADKIAPAPRHVVVERSQAYVQATKCLVEGQSMQVYDDEVCEVGVTYLKLLFDVSDIYNNPRAFIDALPRLEKESLFIENLAKLRLALYAWEYSQKFAFKAELEEISRFLKQRWESWMEKWSPRDMAGARVINEVVNRLIAKH